MKTKRKKLTDKLDRLFSQYIRLRDADEFGRCSCITCGKSLFWKEIHAGHFQSRGNKATRWNEYNVNAQCCGCNTFKAGEQYKHGKAIDDKFGTGMADSMEKLARTTKKFTTKELEEEVEYYNEQVKELRELKGI